MSPLLIGMKLFGASRTWKDTPHQAKDGDDHEFDSQDRGPRLPKPHSHMILVHIGFLSKTNLQRGLVDVSFLQKLP